MIVYFKKDILRVEMQKRISLLENIRQKSKEKILRSFQKARDKYKVSEKSYENMGNTKRRYCERK